VQCSWCQPAASPLPENRRCCTDSSVPPVYCCPSAAVVVLLRIAYMNNNKGNDGDRGKLPSSHLVHMCASICSTLPEHQSPPKIDCPLVPGLYHVHRWCFPNRPRTGVVVGPANDPATRDNIAAAGGPGPDASQTKHASFDSILDRSIDLAQMAARSLRQSHRSCSSCFVAYCCCSSSLSSLMFPWLVFFIDRNK
jgi:hypothetical protein